MVPLRAFLRQPRGGVAARTLRRTLHVCLAGTDDVTLATLRRLHAALDSAEERPISCLTVITPSARPMGRGHKSKQPPVLEFASAHGAALVDDGGAAELQAAQQASRFAVVTVPYGL